ncbi:MAG: SIR2 family protein [Dissulfurispiraceae bacterium]
MLKIHGSVTNYGSIVATTSDYAKCQKRLHSGVIGGLLKTILATQTVIFVGYSFSDSDFSAIYKFVKKQMNSLHRQAYVVAPSAEDCEKFRIAGLMPIQTDGTFFFAQVKEHAVAQGTMIDDGIYNAASELLEIVVMDHCLLHETIRISDHPEVIFAASYQDGMIHALERAISMRGTGQYSHRCRITEPIKAYQKWQKEKLSQGIYEDVAYIEGYINGLTYLLMNKAEREAVRVPVYYMFGVKDNIGDLADFCARLRRNPNAHKAACKRALRYLESLSEPKSAEFHHPPWL